MSPRAISILGSTGSIGCNTLRVIEALGNDRFQVVALAAGRNISKLADQIARHEPELVSVESEELSAELKSELSRRSVKLPSISVGESGLVEVATHAKADCVVSATVGAVGFVPSHTPELPLRQSFTRSLFQNENAARGEPSGAR